MDYYEIMGVSEDATQDEIKKAYRQLARKYHPDVSKEADAETRFKEISEANLVLKDPEKRQEYDDLRKYGPGGAGGPGTAPPGWDTGTDDSSWHFRGGNHQYSTGDVFEELFRRQGGGAGGQGFAMHGDDAHYKIEVSLDEAFRGASRAISFQSSEVDDQGQIRPRTSTINVTIPKGVINGQQLRLKGKGNPGYGDGRPGDLYLEINIAPHPLYSVEGRNLSLELPVAPWEIALGERVDVPTMDGPVRLKIPENARAGQKLRVKGKGLPASKSSGTPGDLFVVLQVAMPPTLSDDDRRLFEQMKQQIDFNPRAGMRV